MSKFQPVVQAPVRIQQNILARSERRLLNWICPRLPQWMTPDKLTVPGIGASVAVGVALAVEVAVAVDVGMTVAVRVAVSVDPVGVGASDSAPKLTVQ